MAKALKVNPMEKDLPLSYTKHYYIGSERVSAKTGTMDWLGYYPSSWLYEEMPALNIDVQTESSQKFSNAATQVATIHELFNLPLSALNTTDNFTIIHDVTHDLKKMDVFYFHPDHLGSSSYITNMTGMVSQHMEYLPFGELLVDEHKNSYNSPFKYNGKEFDEETGNYYYGARYYDPKWSIFISVDPLAEKYPNISPYAYVANNPINLIDPDGREIKDGKETFNKFKDYVMNKIKSLNNEANDLKGRATLALEKGKTGRANTLNSKAEKVTASASAYSEVLKELNTLESSDQVYNIYTNSSDIGKSAGGNVQYDTSTHAVNVNIKENYDMNALSHELKHAYQFETGLLSFDSSGKRGGALYDLQDEYEAYSRGTLFGGSSRTLKSIQSSYKSISSRTSQLTFDTSEFSGGPTMGDQLKATTNRAYKTKSRPLNYYKGWKQHYK